MTQRGAIGPRWNRLLATAAVLATVSIGAYVNAGAQLVAVIAVVVAMLVPERGRHADLAADERAG